MIRRMTPAAQPLPGIDVIADRKLIILAADRMGHFVPLDELKPEDFAKIQKDWETAQIVGIPRYWCPGLGVAPKPSDGWTVGHFVAGLP